MNALDYLHQPSIHLGVSEPDINSFKRFLLPAASVASGNFAEAIRLAGNVPAL
jgi:hypothetical protein